MGVWLDTAIGVTFVFLLFSTVISGVQEAIAWAFEIRAHTMRRELSRLLTDPSAEALLKELLAHPLIRQHAGTALPWRGDQSPSYLPPSAFSGALIDMFTGSSARDALPALREKFLAEEVNPIAKALHSVFALERPEGEAGAIAELNAALIAPRDADLKNVRDRVEELPPSLLKALALAALVKGSRAAPVQGAAAPPDTRYAAVERLARVVARRSPARALRQWLDKFPRTTFSNALLTVIEAGSAEARSDAVKLVEEIVKGVGAGTSTLAAEVANLPESAVKGSLTRLVTASTDAARAAEAVDLGRLLETDPIGELRHAARLMGPGSELGRMLLATLDAGAGAAASVHKHVEGMFDHAMEHCSSVFRRYVQLTLLGIAAVVTVLANVDTLRVVRELSSNAAMRSAVAEMASERVRAHPAADADAPIAPPSEGVVPGTRAVQEALQVEGLPIGWDAQECARFDFPLCTAAPPIEHPPAKRPWSEKIVGWLLTVFALSLGAPFWFGIVNRLVNLRTGGRPPHAAAR